VAAGRRAANISGWFFFSTPRSHVAHEPAHRGFTVFRGTLLSYMRRASPGLAAARHPRGAAAAAAFPPRHRFDLRFRLRPCVPYAAHLPREDYFAGALHRGGGVIAPRKPPAPTRHPPPPPPSWMPLNPKWRPPPPPAAPRAPQADPPRKPSRTPHEPPCCMLPGLNHRFFRIPSHTTTRHRLAV
jgi:hypothetical protein